MEFIQAESLRNHWYPVIDVSDVGDQPVKVTLLGADYVVWHTPDGSVAAAPDRCPHREAPLSIGWIEDGNLVCAYHGWAFGDEGRCVEVPSSGAGATVPPAAHLPCVHAEARYGLVWICPGTPAASIPMVPHDADPAFRRINTGVDVWKTAATRMVDNFLDISHFPWVHTGTFGDGLERAVPKIELQQLDDDFYGYAYEVDANNPDEANVISGSDEPTVHRWMTTGYALPLIVRSTIRYADGLEHILLLCSTPIDNVTSYFTFVVWRNDDHSLDPEETIAFDRAIGAEDKAMLQRVPGTLPLGQTDMVSVQSDRPSVDWRRNFLALVEQ